MFFNNKKVSFIDKKAHVHGADITGKSTYTRASFMFSKGDKIFIDQPYSQRTDLHGYFEMANPDNHWDKKYFGLRDLENLKEVNLPEYFLIYQKAQRSKGR